ncbi:hypothetical protein C8_377 [Cannes 8 virus]|uniref:hypothetical protein n=1 Tax=Melbournevirus TaxID=1560514 RepID=UPI000392B385|nr:hypothetical protein MEL_321 [Melbournevirus]AGV01726.1 hypothetical protein C8_377 [Cannes 8 virus]AIT54934.1 hypothetical protein MEL_321 [Melbournevirus]AVR53075.1 hypothetical protein MarSH_370 [Marseillevirus Shanghai 1]
MSEFFCPCCEQEIEDAMNEGWYCEDCGYIYNLCPRCEGGKHMEFVSASVPKQDIDGYSGMALCKDQKILDITREHSFSFGQTIPKGSVVVKNKIPGLTYADVGKGNGLSEPACYIWRCTECGRYEDTSSD